MTTGRVLGVFAKEPAAGRVKTRLAAGRPPAWAAAVAAAFLGDTLERFRHVGDRRVVAFAPAEARAYFAGIAGPHYDLEPQADGDLGARLRAFIEAELRRGAGRVVVLGTDSPTLPVEYVERAFAELDRCDVVLGPATDGGYYLLGCGPRVPPAFDAIAWGTSGVLAQTVARLEGWRLALLPPWYDVDTPDDWRMLCGHLAALRAAGVDAGVPRTMALES